MVYKVSNFSNLNELVTVFHNPITVAIDYVTNKIIEELQMQMTSMKIGLNSNSFYTPTGEFYEAWKQGIVKNLGSLFSSEVYYDPSNMSVDPENFIHGSNYYYTDDVRDILPYIIFQGNAGHIFGIIS